MAFSEESPTIHPIPALKYTLCDDHEVTFVSQPPKEVQFECSICLQILTDPCLLDCKCGYSFCRKCIEPIQLKKKNCPLCNMKFSTILPNIRLGIAIKELVIKCSNEESGCTWTGEMGQLTKHLNVFPEARNRLEGCEYTMLKCQLCPYQCKRREMARHKTRLCTERRYTCEYCNQYTSTFKDVYTNHWPVCSFFTKACERGASSSGLELASVFTPTVLEASGGIVTNCDLAGQQGVKEIQVDAILEKVSLSKIQPNKQQGRRVATENDIVDYMVTVVPSSVNSTESVTNERQALNGPIIVLTMNNYSNFKDPDNVWYSQQFYTHSQGYCMCLAVQHNKGGYLSVSTHLLKGDYDKELRWPLLGKVCIKLIDQISERNHSRMVEYSKEVGIECAGRVKDKGKRSKPLGKQNFIACRSLQPNFLKDDMLWFDVHCKLLI